MHFQQILNVKMQLDKIKLCRKNVDFLSDCSSFSFAEVDILLTVIRLKVDG